MQKKSQSAFHIDPVDYADPLFGVGSATSAGPSLPAGSIHPSPETLENDCGGYLRGQPIVGFGNLYTSGSGGRKCYGNFLLAPCVGEAEPNREKRASNAVNGREKAHCYAYEVLLENGIFAKVTPAHHAAIYSFTYPECERASLFLDVAHKLDIDASLKSGSLTLDPAHKRILGGGRCFGNWNKIDFDLFFAMEFDADFEEIGILEGEELRPVSAFTPTTVQINEEKRLGAYIGFGGGGTVQVKLAVSFVSTERAQEHLAREIPDFDFDRVCRAAKDKWRAVLGAAELYTDDPALLRRFHTALYHVNLQPRDRTRDHGKWDDFHTVWDTWKTVFPLYSLLWREKMGAIVDSMLDRAAENEKAKSGIVLADDFVAAKEFLAGQGGNDTDNVITDAFLRGIPLKRHNWREALTVLQRSATQMRSPEYIKWGYATDNQKTVSGVPYSWRMLPAAATMGFAFNDKAIAAMALEMGEEKIAAALEARSANWLNVWNEKNKSEGFFGFPQSRNEGGGFDADFNPHGGYNSHFYEATAWDASYFNYNDTARMIAAMGGAARFTERLLFACEHSVNYYNDDHGKEGYLNFTNEPSFHIPWLFCLDEIRRPDLAAKVIDGIIKRFSGKDDYPGDEDNGGMSSYYVFLMCGIFPFATTKNYYLHGTRVEKIVLRLGNGADLTITGENVGGENIYVQSATWRGAPLDECKLTNEDLAAGGTLHFVMGNAPSNWAR